MGGVGVRLDPYPKTHPPPVLPRRETYHANPDPNSLLRVQVFTIVSKGKNLNFPPIKYLG